MLLKLQIIFTILCALCLAAFVPIGSLLGWPAAILCGLGAALFFVLMLLCKQSISKSEAEKTDETVEEKQDEEQ